ncbi:MAG: 2-oxoacid:acceptor oxidoreductase subunit alpha [bacterium]|nr:2-oxoacid:acceptor oxidoreductase subunit alpha [bacterium]
MTDFTLKIGGEAGQGIASSGLIFGKLALRSGYFVFDTNEYPSLIRGGHNTYATRVSEEKVFSQSNKIDILIALDQNTVDFHQDELSPGSIIILNSEKYSNPVSSDKVNVFLIPLIKLAKDAGGSEVMMNNVALGAAVFFLKADFGILESVIRDVFASAKPEMIDLNIKSAKAGFNFAKENFATVKVPFSLERMNNIEQLFLTGNDAFCLGAVKAGCKFFAAYPMTPINSIIAYFAAKAKELGMVYFQPEDEIAAVNSAIGSASTGVRSMTATSGGGFSLMVEALGMAGMTETPIVIINGQRPGPSSGLPTWTGQGDLKFVLSAGQDDFPRIVLAPGDVEECFWMATEAFNLADKYQVPVIILTDKYLSESRQSVAVFDESKVKIDRGLLLSEKDQQNDFKRYAFTRNGISPRAIVGRQGPKGFLINSYEHDESGFSTEDPKIRTAMMEKRMKKLETIEKEMPKPLVYGDKKANFLFIGWGSTKGPVLEAQKILEDEGFKTKFLFLNYLNPFPKEEVASVIKSSKKVLLIEQNAVGQLGDLIEQKTGLEIKERFLKYDGRPFNPEEIVEKVSKIIKNPNPNSNTTNNQ